MFETFGITGILGGQTYPTSPYGWGMQNVQAVDTMAARLEAAKTAQRSPHLVERLPNGRGWQVKSAGSWLNLALMRAQSNREPSPPIGHDRPEWV